MSNETSKTVRATGTVNWLGQPLATHGNTLVGLDKRLAVVELLKSVKGNEQARMGELSKRLLDDAITRLETAPLTPAVMHDIYDGVPVSGGDVVVGYGRALERAHGLR
jgi:hypothetical protein